jgi:hypothetical protein
MLPLKDKPRRQIIRPAGQRFLNSKSFASCSPGCLQPVIAIVTPHPVTAHGCLRVNSSVVLLLSVVGGRSPFGPFGLTSRIRKISAASSIR